MHGSENFLVDLTALDSPPGPAIASIAGPMFALDELAGRKVIAMSDRAAARDFVDVCALGQRYSQTELLGLARYGDVDLALGDVDSAALRACFQQWMTELEAG